MAFYKQDIVDINLNTGSIFRSFLAHSIGYKDDDADRFGIRAFRDGVPVDLSGASCQAIFMNPNGTNIALTSYGTVSGNVAYVTLPPACYDYEGQFCLAIKLVGGGVTGTVRIVDGTVTRTGASGTVSPTSAVPTYQEILSTYDAMVAATSAANLAIAETFDATKAYPAGKYVINEGHLYRLTADHAANVTWENTSKVATNFGDDLSSLKSAFINNNVSVVVQYQNGYINSSGVITSNAVHHYSELIPVECGERYHLVGRESTAAMIIAMYASDSGNADTNKSIMGTNANMDIRFEIPNGIHFIRIGYIDDYGKPVVYKTTSISDLVLTSEMDEMFIHGKNQLESYFSRLGTNGIDITLSNGILTIDGTVTNTENIFIPVNDILTGNKTLSIKRKVAGVIDNLALVNRKPSGAVDTTFIDVGVFNNDYTEKSATGNITSGEGLYLGVRLTSGRRYTDFVSLLQIEDGSTATAIEQPNVIFRNNTEYAIKREVEETYAKKSEIIFQGKRPLRVCLLGDVHISGNTREYTGMTWLERMTLLADSVNKEHNKKPFDFLLCTGDLVFHPSASDSEEWWRYRVAYMFNMPVYIMAGNHEYSFNDERFREMTGNPRQFSIEKDNWYFICLDTFNQSTEYTGIDMDFVAAEMAKANGRNVIMCGHYFQSDAVLEGLKEQYPNIVLFDYAHTHAWAEHQLSDGTWALNNGSFSDPQKNWSNVGTAANPTTNLWGFRILETVGTILKTYQIQPAHNYTGININLPYSVNDQINIATFDLTQTADYVIGKVVNNKKYSDRFAYIQNT